MILGYARTSTGDQDHTLQTEAFRAAGVEKIFQETASGGRWDRPELQRMLDQIRPGDVVVVWKLDRLSRSLKDLLLLMEKIEAAGAGFRSITEHLDTTTPAGRMQMQLIGVFADYERAILRERTREGLLAARRQGRVGGRRPKLTPAQRDEVVEMVRSGRRTAGEAAALFGCHRATIYRVLGQDRERP